MLLKLITPPGSHHCLQCWPAIVCHHVVPPAVDVLELGVDRVPRLLLVRVRVPERSPTGHPPRMPGDSCLARNRQRNNRRIAQLGLSRRRRRRRRRLLGIRTYMRGMTQVVELLMMLLVLVPPPLLLMWLLPPPPQLPLLLLAGWWWSSWWSSCPHLCI